MHDDRHRTALHKFLHADGHFLAEQLFCPELFELLFQVATLLDELGERGRDDQLHVHLHGQRYHHDRALLIPACPGGTGRRCKPKGQCRLFVQFLGVRSWPVIS
jgi:hypothetical protein